jgi:phenylpyruvate tautomerase PptA (4-oxalocrotonate tautomerase family)
MPSTRILTGDWAKGREMDLILAVQSAMVSAIKIPDWDRDVVVNLYDDKRRIVPTGKSERFTRVEIELFSGRAMKAKRELYRAIVRNLAGVGVPGDEIKVILVEIDPQNWGVRGGRPASEIEIGFKIDI